MLPADEQEVIWIDGLSIELNQLSPELEPVGICVAINGNKAIVKYKEEYDNIRWAASNRWEMDDAYIIELISSGQPVSIEIHGELQNNKLSLTEVSSRQDFVDALNDWFTDNNLNYFSSELVELDTDLPASDTSDEKDGDNYRNRIIVNNEFTENNGWKSINIGGDSGSDADGKHIFNDEFYISFNNGFFGYYDDDSYPLNKAKLYDILPDFAYSPEEPLESINDYIFEDDFKNNINCQILRDNFASYDDYVDSLLVKVPCGTGKISDHPSGKENTYKLSDCKYTKLNGDKEYLYPAARKAASIHVNGPKLTKGNWWLPSPAEMVQMMRDITYETSFWDSKPDIVNRVIDKIRTVDNSWTYLSASSNDLWTICLLYNSNPVNYDSNYGFFGFNSIETLSVVSPITIYEF